MSIKYAFECSNTCLTCLLIIFTVRSAIKMEHAIHMRGAPDWLYDCHIPDFLSHYDRVDTEWKGMTYERPSPVRQ